MHCKLTPRTNILCIYSVYEKYLSYVYLIHGNNITQNTGVMLCVYGLSYMYILISCKICVVNTLYIHTPHTQYACIRMLINILYINVTICTCIRSVAMYVISYQGGCKARKAILLHTHGICSGLYIMHNLSYENVCR